MRRALILIVAAGMGTGVAAAPGSTAARFDRHGISFTYPSAWFVTTRPLTNGVNPVYRFAVGTAPVRRTSRDSGPCLPGIAARLRRTDVLAYLRETLGADRARSLPRMVPRPSSFRLPAQADRSLCGFGRGGRWLPFQEAGRAFYLGIYVGPAASPERVRRLRRLLDELRIEPR